MVASVTDETDVDEVVSGTSTLGSDTVDVQSALRDFTQRQSDVFASLAPLETAHFEFNRTTKTERKEIQRSAWRRIQVAPEDLSSTEKVCWQDLCVFICSNGF